MKRHLGFVLLVAAIGAATACVLGCGEGSSSTGTSEAKEAFTEPESVAACIQAWNKQGLELPKESAALAVGEKADYEAWVSVYEGKPVTIESGGFSMRFAGHHCLVAIPGEGAAFAYEEGHWGPRAKGGESIYEYAVDPANASRAKIITNANLTLRP